MELIHNRSKKVALGLLVVLLTLSCGESKELTREKAKEVISKNYPKVVTGNMKKEILILTNLHEIQSHPWVNSTIAEANRYKHLVDENLIEFVNPRNYSLFNMQGITYNVQLSPKTINLLVNQDVNNINVKIAEITFSEITGIVKDASGRAATVEYNVEETNYTPFAEYLGSQERKGLKMKMVEHFLLYDDGWRLERSAYNSSVPNVPEHLPKTFQKDYQATYIPPKDDGLKRELEKITETIRAAHLNKDINKWLSCYASSYPSLEQAKNKVLTLWNNNDIKSVAYRIDNVQPISDKKAIANIVWNIEIYDRQRHELNLLRKRYRITLERDSIGWKIRDSKEEGA